VLNLPGCKRNTQQITLRFHLTQLEWLSSREKSAINAGEDAVKQEILNTVVGMQISTTIKEKSMDSP
jgi:hypothetical protein